jgi:hypothetical protein
MAVFPFNIHAAAGRDVDLDGFGISERHVFQYRTKEALAIGFGLLDVLRTTIPKGTTSFSFSAEWASNPLRISQLQRFDTLANGSGFADASRGSKK